MSRRELLGWVPTQTHHTYSPEGEHLSTTQIVREPRINDRDRSELLELMKFEAEICDCGYHPIIASDLSNVFQPETRTCPVCAGQAKWRRVLAGEDKAVPHDAPPKISRPSDGQHPQMRLLPPAEADRARSHMRTRTKADTLPREPKEG